MTIEQGRRMKICWMMSWFVPHRRATEYNRRQEQMQVIAHHWIARAFTSRICFYWLQEWTYFTVCFRSSKHWEKVKCLYTFTLKQNLAQYPKVRNIQQRVDRSISANWFSSPGQLREGMRSCVYPKCCFLTAKVLRKFSSCPQTQRKFKILTSKILQLPSATNRSIGLPIDRRMTSEDWWKLGRNLRMDRNGYDDTQYVTM